MAILLWHWVRPDCRALHELAWQGYVTKYVTKSVYPPRGALAKVEPPLGFSRDPKRGPTH